MSVSPNLSGFLICANLHLLDNVSLFLYLKNFTTEGSLLFITGNIPFFSPASGDTKLIALLRERTDIRAEKFQFLTTAVAYRVILNAKMEISDLMVI